MFRGSKNVPPFLQVSEGRGIVAKQTHRLPLKRLSKIKEAHVIPAELSPIDGHRAFLRRPYFGNKIGPPTGSEASDQNRRSGRRDSRETPARRFRMSDHQNRSNAFEGVQATDIDSFSKSQRACNRNWRDLIRRRPPGTRRQSEESQPNRLLQQMMPCCLQDRNSSVCDKRLLHSFLHRESPQVGLLIIMPR